MAGHISPHADLSKQECHETSQNVANKNHEEGNPDKMQLEHSDDARAVECWDFSSLTPICLATQDFSSQRTRFTLEATVGVSTENNFLKGASFSPDGTCLLTASEDTVLRVFEVPSHALREGDLGIDRPETIRPEGASRGDQEWKPCLHSVEGETIYDFAWWTQLPGENKSNAGFITSFESHEFGKQYPHMSSAEPATCVFVSTCRDHPLHMWDAFTGNLRATYRAYDHLDEIVAANSVCFNNGGNKIFAGYNRMVRVFDVAQPGRSFEARPTCKTRKSTNGQRGIISALDFSPDPAGGGLFAAGSYARSVCLYSENSRSRAIAEFSTPNMGGITHLKFAPDGRLLFSGSRKDPEIVCWDIRQTKEALHTFQRKVDTNQRISFDVDPSGTYLATGSTGQEARVYDIKSQRLVGGIENQPDAVSSVSFHPYAAMLSVCTGQRHFDLASIAGSDGEDALRKVSIGDDLLTDCKVGQARNGVAIYRVGTSVRQLESLH